MAHPDVVDSPAGRAGVVTAPLSRAEILALPPTHGLPVLGRILGVSEPVIRERARRGELAELGIKVVKLGAQYRVVTASVWAFLGLDPAADGANGEAPPRRAARQGKATASALRSVRGGG
jgi:hypothetical protein